MQHYVLCAFPQNPSPATQPGVKPQRPSLPVNITPLVHLNSQVSNNITVSWKTGCRNNYGIAVYLVRKLTSSELLQRLKTHSVRHSNVTRDLSKYTEFVSVQVSVVDVAKIISFPHMEYK